MTTTLSKNEEIKGRSRHLRGTILDGLDEVITGGIAEDDTQLTKFHGTYQQDDRDLRPERRRKRMEKAFSFMVRVRVAGGVVTPAQWLALDRLADDYANGTLRLTTRQAFQFHGVIKFNLKRTMQGIHDALMDTIAACGDVNRNVMATANPHLSDAHEAALGLARAISDHLTPRTPAYHEIWLEGEKVVDTSDGAEVEPIYGPTYLPRKFKIAVAVPPTNDVDVFAQDLGFVGITDASGNIVGWDVTVGGGMGMTHGEPETYPRAGSMLGFCTPEQAVDVAEKVVLVQRDFGDRANRKHARLKYTIDDRGLDRFRNEVEKRLGYALEPGRGFTFARMGDAYGWVKDPDGRWHFTLFIASGRVKDDAVRLMKTGLAAIARVHDGDFRLTPNQNLIIANVSPRKKARIDRLLRAYRIDNRLTGLRLNGIACVGLPTCGLSLAESERYLPELIDALDEVVESAGLRDDEIVIRMSGCPNGCSRPYLAEIGVVGKGPGRYNLYLGAAFDGTRLNKLFREDLDHAGLITALTPLIEGYARERLEGERFGDFVIRAGHVRPTREGRDFHDGATAGQAAA
jgi:sulfite reductase (NADPH) hemoprotein beta-component